MKSNLKKKMAKRGDHGGVRLGAGRRPRPDAEEWGRVTCALKLKTIQALRDGAGAKSFGRFLQWHLERHPLPSHEVYQNILAHKPIIEVVRGRRTQVIYSTSTPNSVCDPRMPRRRRKVDVEYDPNVSIVEQLSARFKAREAERKAAWEAREKAAKGDGNGDEENME